ncbi:MAG: hypothetical protein MRY83_02860 [Flavobacteriales bacterium]|nr:hypothetical protein [Flavobacteriales bacterium]
MNYIIYAIRIVIVLALLIGSTYARGLQLELKSIADYYVTSSERDSSLPLNKSKFHLEFHFTPSDGDGQGVDEIIFSRNGREGKLTLKDGSAIISAHPGKHVFQFFANENYFEIKTDSIEIRGGYSTHIVVNFMSSIEPVIMDKPVIYFYPKDKLNVDVKLKMYEGELNFTYPKYDEGWNFTAQPSGNLLFDAQVHTYLFWEAETQLNYQNINLESGFIVHSDTLITFLERKLEVMGFNFKEKEDFITYWGPLMTRNELNYVHFMFNKEVNEYSKLDISPKPDAINRMFMVWGACSDQMPNIKAQEIETFDRAGFDVLEWGGSRIRLFENLSYAQ